MITISIPCNLSVLEILLPFVKNTMQYYGANEKESQEMMLAVEEAAAGTIERFSGFDAGGFIEISCAFSDNGIEITLQDKGMPIDLKKLPDYDTEHPEESIFGLRLYLMRKLSDRFEFKNKGSGGWETILFKKLSSPVNPNDFSLQNEEKHDDTSKSHPSFTVRQLEPEEAYQIVQLSYRTYRYTYSKDDFYYPDAVENYIQSGKMTSIGAFNHNEELVGHVGALTEKDDPGVIEFGVVMIDPRYRQSLCLLKLLRAARKYADKNKENLYIFKFVTAHTQSQKIGELFKVTPTALQLAYHDQAAFSSMNVAARERESLLISCVSFKEKIQTEIFPPPEHSEIILKILSAAGYDIEEKQPSSIPQLIQETEMTSSCNDLYKVVFIRVQRKGRNFYANIKKERFDLAARGIQSFYLYLPLWDAAFADTAEGLADQGFFFSGIYPHSQSRWYAAYTYVTPKIIEYDKIMLDSTSAIELRDYVKKCNDMVIPY
ncbi:MAG: hypothetical protein A2020_12400 [Lentisphaerae bacterium GWF2_45_14]|nr:MAG: hypothetical protein A2020_12400 [Lentisphaerae bacterium GWF2_45_14]